MIFRVVLFRIRLFPTLISKIKWLVSALPLNLILDIIFSIPWHYSQFNSRQFQKSLLHYLLQVNFYFVFLHIAMVSVLLQ